MNIKRSRVTREEVIRFYVQYDSHKKGQPQIVDFSNWPWDDADLLDTRLGEMGLKPGAITAYRIWTLATLTIADLLECAIVNHIFPGEPQAIGRLVLRGLLSQWMPKGASSWWRPISTGADVDARMALVLRPALRSEAPAKWYVEDGSGRALALVQRILHHSETTRTAFAYVGCIPEKRSPFILSHPELRVSPSMPCQPTDT